MKIIDSALDLLQPGEFALVLHTTGVHLTINRDGSGSTGYWVVDRNRQVNKVIIHQQVLNRVGLSYDVFIADYAGVEVAPEEGRWLILLKNVTLAGLTDMSWKDFANTGQNSVRYLSK